jgi:hypothetical protein
VGLRFAAQIDPATEKKAAASRMGVALANAALIELRQLILVFIRLRQGFGATGRRRLFEDWMTDAVFIFLVPSLEGLSNECRAIFLESAKIASAIRYGRSAK